MMQYLQSTTQQDEYLPNKENSCDQSGEGSENFANRADLRNEHRKKSTDDFCYENIWAKKEVERQSASKIFADIIK